LKLAVALDGVALYADPATILKSGNMVTMWELMDSKTAEKAPDNKVIHSLVAQTEYDCKEERMRTLYAVYGSENMGSGKKTVFIDGPGKWRPIEPGTVGVTLWKFVCGK